MSHFDEPYDFNQCTIQVSLQILPRGEDGERQASFAGRAAALCDLH